MLSRGPLGRFLCDPGAVVILFLPFPPFKVSCFTNFYGPFLSFIEVFFSHIPSVSHMPFTILPKGDGVWWCVWCPPPPPFTYFVPRGLATVSCNLFWWPFFGPVVGLPRCLFMRGLVSPAVPPVPLCWMVPPPRRCTVGSRSVWRPFLSWCLTSGSCTSPFGTFDFLTPLISPRNCFFFCPLCPSCLLGLNSLSRLTVNSFFLAPGEAGFPPLQREATLWLSFCVVPLLTPFFHGHGASCVPRFLQLM